MFFDATFVQFSRHLRVPVTPWARRSMQNRFAVGHIGTPETPSGSPGE